MLYRQIQLDVVVRNCNSHNVATDSCEAGVLHKRKLLYQALYCIVAICLLLSLLHVPSHWRYCKLKDMADRLLFSAPLNPFNLQQKPLEYTRIYTAAGGSGLRRARNGMRESSLTLTPARGGTASPTTRTLKRRPGSGLTLSEPYRQTHTLNVRV